MHQLLPLATSSTEQSAECHLGRKLLPNSTSSALLIYPLQLSLSTAQPCSHKQQARGLCQGSLPSAGEGKGSEGARVLCICLLLFTYTGFQHMPIGSHASTLLTTVPTTGTTAGVMQHHCYPKACMKYQLQIFAVALAALRFLLACHWCSKLWPQSAAILNCPDD